MRFSLLTTHYKNKHSPPDNQLMIRLSFTVNHTYESLIMLRFICFLRPSRHVPERCFWWVSKWCQLKQQDPTNTYKGIKCWQRRPEKFSFSRVDGHGFSASCSWQKWYRWFELALNPLSWDTQFGSVPLSGPPRSDDCVHCSVNYTVCSFSV